MKLFRESDLLRKNPEFEVLTQGATTQTALMVLPPGGSSGEYGNEHPDSDQVLFVTGGSGEAIVEGETVTLREGDLLVIKAGEKHQVKNTGHADFRTLNVYAPPAY